MAGCTGCGSSKKSAESWHGSLDNVVSVQFVEALRAFRVPEPPVSSTADRFGIWAMVT